MLNFLARRLVTMLLTALCLTFIVFALTNLHPNLEKLAKQQASVRMSDAQVISWLASHGYARPLVQRYGEWLGVVPGWTGKDAEGRPTGRWPRPAG
jgi:peptide/nickel transport system permease protein